MLIIMLEMYWLFSLFSTLQENFYNIFFTFVIKNFENVLAIAYVYYQEGALPIYYVLLALLREA